MKKLLIVFLVMFSGFILVSCGPEEGGSDLDPTKTNVVLLVNGNLGDMSFFDSANDGIKNLNKNHGEKVFAKTIEIGEDTTQWDSTLARQSKIPWDLIICATPAMREALQKVSKQNPDRKYIIFDGSVHPDNPENYPNVHSIEFRQNEASFLAGILAGKIANGSSGMPAPVMGAGKAGFIGGMKNEVIYDFVLGYADGIMHVNNEDTTTAKMYNTYVGNFSDSTKGKALADAQYNNNTDIIFVAASQAGLGVLDSAAQKQKFVIGVDGDQYAQYKEKDPNRAKVIVTSVLKRGDIAIEQAVLKFMDGKLEFGKIISQGLKEQQVGLADNENYQKLVPEVLRNYIKDIENKIINGEIVVKAKAGMSNPEADDFLAQIEPK